MDRTTEPIEITLKMHGITYKVSGLDWDSNSAQLIEAFTRLMVAGGYDPSVIQCEDGARFEVEVVND